MRIYLKLFLKIFLRIGILFFIYWEVIESIEHGFPKGLSEGLFMGIWMALTMPLIMSLFHIRGVKRITSGKYDEKDVLSVHHIRNIELQLPYDRTFDLCVSSLSLIKKCKIQKEDRSQGKIKAKVVDISWKSYSWGEVISFNICKIDNNKTQVEVSSRPVIFINFIECGKNLQNVMKIIGFLKKRMP